VLGNTNVEREGPWSIVSGGCPQNAGGLWAGSTKEKVKGARRGLKAIVDEVYIAPLVKDVAYCNCVTPHRVGHHRDRTPPLLIRW
jgi:hypothetical protein